ncbi:MAG: hypothetical protein V1652_01445 [bacterium]
MNSGRKIYINKTESAPAVIEKILQSNDTQIRLYIPRGALIGHSEHTLSLIKRESETAGKSLIIESVDDDILTLADAIGLHAVNPFFGRGKKAVTDIVMRSVVDVNEENDTVAAVPDMPESKSQGTVAETTLKKGRRFPAFVTASSRIWSWRRFSLALGATALIVGVISIAGFLLPRANMNLVFERSAWNFDTELLIDLEKQSANLGDTAITLPGMVLTEKKEATQVHLANDRGKVERKAKGKVTVYNVFDTNPQLLVANTRIESPDGKIYRIEDKITVPGAIKTGNKLVPQGVTVSVVADGPGDTYNSGPVSRFTIPGFEGTSRYDGFYASSEIPITGGFIGETALPTNDDVLEARKQAKESLFEVLKTAILSNVPDDIVVAGDMIEISVVDEVIDRNVNEKGEFSVTLYGEARAFGFREDDFKSLLTKQMEKGTGDFVLEEYSITVPNDVGVDFSKTQVHANAHIATVWARAFDLAAFKKEAVNKDKDEIKALIFSLPGIKSAEVRLWPFWVRRVPDNDDRINVDVSYKL